MDVCHVDSELNPEQSLQDLHSESLATTFIRALSHAVLTRAHGRSATAGCRVLIRLSQQREANEGLGKCWVGLLLMIFSVCWKEGNSVDTGVDGSLSQGFI